MAGKSSKTSKSKKTEQERQEKQEKQRFTVILFSVGVLLFCLVLIKGDGVWNKLHSFLFGMFGWVAYGIAPICIYFAVMLTQGKDIAFVKRKAIQAAILALMACAAFAVFGGMPDEDNLAKQIQLLYLDGIAKKGGGLLSILIAGPISLIGSKPIPQIILVLAMFVFFMLVTGAGLSSIINFIKKPLSTAKNKYDDYKKNMVDDEDLEQTEEFKFVTEKPTEHSLEETPKQDQTSEIALLVNKHKFDIDIDISEDKTPEELDKTVPIEPTLIDFKDIPLNDPNISFNESQEFSTQQENTKELKDVRDVLADWGFDAPVQTIQVQGNENSTLNDTIELEERPHPLEEDIEQAKEEDVLQVVQEYLDSIDKMELSEDYSIDIISRQKNTIEYDEPEIETFKADFDYDTVFEPIEVLKEPIVTEDLEVEATSELEINNSKTPWDDVVDRAKKSSLEQDTEISNILKDKRKIEKTTYKDGGYRLPSINLLEEIEVPSRVDISQELQVNAQKLIETLESFGVRAKIIDIARGPAVTRYEIQPAPGVKISKITNLADDIALNLAAAGIRIEAPIPNKAAVGIEVPNKDIRVVRIRELLESKEYLNSSASIAVVLGKDITGNRIVADISKMPHMLIAGATGSGKSVCINAIIMSILYKYSPDEVKLLMIDPKVVELGGYNGIPHLLVPVVTEPKKAAGALSWAVSEMLQRYKLFAEHNVRDITGYNRLVDKKEDLEYMPKVVMIIDELADLMMASPSEVEDSIARLAQMARAAGMHLIIATQRPSVDVITGLIKANVPSRIAFSVSSQIDSRTILDMGGAEKLLGRGDMLFYPVGTAKPMRVQGCFVTDEEVNAVVKHVKKYATAQYDEKVAEKIESLADRGKGSISAIEASLDDEDEMIPYAIECIVEAGQGSTSLLQRRLKLGYARAARIIDQLEDRGIVGPFEGSKPRQLLITKDQYLEMKLAGLDQPNAIRKNRNED